SGRGASAADTAADWSRNAAVQAIVNAAIAGSNPRRGRTSMKPRPTTAPGTIASPSANGSSEPVTIAQCAIAVGEGRSPVAPPYVPSAPGIVRTATRNMAASPAGSAWRRYEPRPHRAIATRYANGRTRNCGRVATASAQTTGTARATRRDGFV